MRVCVCACSPVYVCVCFVYVPGVFMCAYVLSCVGVCMFSVCFGSVYVFVRALMCRCVRFVYVFGCVYVCVGALL